MPLTDEEREVMSESEIAQYEEAEASKAQAEAEAAEAEQKAAIDAAVKDRLAAVQAERDEEARLEAERLAAIERSKPSEDRYEKLKDLMYEDPIEYQREILKIAKEESLAEARAEAEAKYGGAARRVQAIAVEDKLSEGLGAKGREFVRKYAHMISEGNADDPLVKDLVQRAAKDYDREHTTRKERIESTHEENIVVSSEERKAADMFAEIAARASGVDITKLKLSDKQLIASREEE